MRAGPQETAAEVERRGVTEVGIYRVNGAASEIRKLRGMFENSPRQAKQQLKVCPDLAMQV